MEEFILPMIVDSFGSASYYFTLIMDRIGMIGELWLAYVMLNLLFRFIIIPVFGSAGSDRASKKNAKSSQSGGDGE